MIIVEKLIEKEDVYDISVKDTNCFFGNGILVHNCAEISLREFQLCNLTEVNASDLESQQDFEDRVKAAAFIGTLQAGYSDFHYLRDIWKRNTEKDRLLGVSMTGIATGKVLELDMTAAAEIVNKENERVANLIGIRKAARTTCVKPSGTVSLVLGTSSGIHAWHSKYYLRRIRVSKNEAIYTYLLLNHPELLEDDYFRPQDTAIIRIPQKAPEGAITREESPFSLLERVKKISQEWIKPGYGTGPNSHNVSATISLKPEEWEPVGEWVWQNKQHFNGLSFLPHDGGSYVQAPFEEISEEEYYRLESTLQDIDLSKVVEMQDNTDLKGELACSGPMGCEIR